MDSRRSTTWSSTTSAFEDDTPEVRGSHEPHRRRLLDLVGRDFPEVEARAHWRGIVHARDELSRALGRQVNVAVAALEYFTRDESPAGRDLKILGAEALANLRGLARTDPLTGVLNRRGLESLLEREAARSRRTGDPCALLACDLDRFKRTNDRHGHPWGDLVLVRLAELLLAHCRGSDAVARLGGDEFLVVLQGTPLEGALTLAERLHVAVAEVDLLRGCPTRGERETVSVSIGVASGILGGSELVARADAALYRAKRAGRGRTAA
jgi:diguanylate cyclase (GGDEF)-like protein